MRPEAVFFDLDDTLVDETGSIREAVRQTVRELQPPGLDPDRVATAYLEASAALWRRVTPARRGVTIRDMRRWTWEEALRALGFGGPLEPLLERYEALRDGVVRPFEDAREVVEFLARNGLRLGIITNGESHLQRRKLERAGLDRFFEAVLTSQDAGVAKPDPRIFLEAARRVGVRPHACWMVGDLLDADVAGALRAGMTAVWVRRHGVLSGEVRPHHTISALRELVPLLFPEDR